MTQISLLAVGIFAGSMGSLIGIGGGFIIIPVLMIFYPELSPTQIAATSLFCVLINALFGFIQSISNKRIDLKTGFMFALASLPGTISGAILSFRLPVTMFRIFLGIIFVVASTLMFLNTLRNSYDDSNSKYKSSDFSRRNFSDKSGNTYIYSYNPTIAIILSTFIGVASSVLGIGGGVFYFPLFVNLLGIPVKVATSTTQFILLLSSFAGTLIFVYYGALSNVPIIMAYIPVGIVIGVIIAGRFVNFVKPVVIVRIFSVILTITGFRMLYTSLY